MQGAHVEGNVGGLAKINQNGLKFKCVSAAPVAAADLVQADDEQEEGARCICRPALATHPMHARGTAAQRYSTSCLSGTAAQRYSTSCLSGTAAQRYSTSCLSGTA